MPNTLCYLVYLATHSICCCHTLQVNNTSHRPHFNTRGMPTGYAPVVPIHPQQRIIAQPYTTMTAPAHPFAGRYNHLLCYQSCCVVLLLYDFQVFLKEGLWYQALIIFLLHSHPFMGPVLISIETDVVLYRIREIFAG